MARWANKRKATVRSLLPLPLELEFEFFAILRTLMLNADSLSGRNGKPFASDLNGEGLLLFQCIC